MCDHPVIISNDPLSTGHVPVLSTAIGDVRLHRIVFIIGRVTQGEDVGG